MLAVQEESPHAARHVAESERVTELSAELDNLRLELDEANTHLKEMKSINAVLATHLEEAVAKASRAT